MLFASLTAALKPRPHTDALFTDHFKAAAGLAVYLIGGSALAVVGLMSVGYAEQLSGAMAALPYVAMLVMVLWFGIGAWLLNDQERQLQTSARNDQAYVQHHTLTRPPQQTVPTMAADDPWELRAFWNQQGPRVQPTTSDTQRTLERTMLLTRPARPVSLFGAYQDA